MNLPVLRAEVDKDGQWEVWCPFCRRHHHHNPRPGLHTAHCEPGSPFLESGYILELNIQTIRGPWWLRWRGEKYEGE